MNLTASLREIETHQGRFDEATATADSLRFDESGLYSGENRWSFGPGGIGAAARFVDAPVAWLEKSLPPALRASVLDHQYSDLGQKSLVLLSRDGELAHVTDSNIRLRNDEVLAAIEEGLGSDVETVAVRNLRYPTETSCEFEVVSERYRDEVRPGDVVEGGIHVVHSIAGEEATLVDAYVVRLLCANGMTRREMCDKRASRTRRLPATMGAARQLQREQIRRLVAETWGTLRSKLEALKPLQQEQVEVPTLLRQFLDRSRLGGRRLLEQLLAAWREQEDEVRTAWAAVNALTYVATHNEDLPARQRRALAALAGVLAFRSLHVCPRCYSLVAS